MLGGTQEHLRSETRISLICSVCDKCCKYGEGAQENYDRTYNYDFLQTTDRLVG